MRHASCFKPYKGNYSHKKANPRFISYEMNLQLFFFGIFGANIVSMILVLGVFYFGVAFFILGKQLFG